MFAQTVKDYLDKTLALQTQMTPWADTKVLPFLLRERYDFFTIFLLNTKRLLMVAKEKTEETPAVIRKHTEMVKQHWDGELIYVPQVITPLNRTRLIEQKVSFIVPGRQLYLPDLGVALSEHFKKFAMTPIKAYSPATQFILMDVFNNGFGEALNGTTLAKKFNFSPMTSTRVFNELEETGLAAIQTRGRERRLEFNLSKRELWEKAKTFFRDPIRMTQKNYERDLDSRGYMVAGLTALSRYSNLAEPEEKTYATDMNPDLRVKTRKEFLYPDWDPEQKACVEVWSYDPKRFAKEGIVDPFSLYLTLRWDQDERIEGALEEMMEKVEW